MSNNTQKPLPVSRDKNLDWVAVKYPELSAWRQYGVQWIASSQTNHREKLLHLQIFFEQYLLRLNLSSEPGLFLKADKVWPSFSDAISHVNLSEKRRIACNDQISDFLSWILASDFSADDSRGHKAPLPGFVNPIRRVQKIADRNVADASLRPHNDKSLRWLARIYPELRDWRELAIEWVAGQVGPSKPRLLALQCFFREFIIGHNLPVVPRDFFDPSRVIPDFYTYCSSERNQSLAMPWTTHVHSFTEWVLTKKLTMASVGPQSAPPPTLRNPIVSHVKKKANKSYDVRFTWVVKARPELEQWRSYAEQWLAGEDRGIDSRLKALSVFFERFLIALNIPSAPEFLLARKSLIPDFYSACCVTGKDGEAKEAGHVVNNNNRVSEFLDWVLITHFSCEDDDGFSVVAPSFRNPVPLRSHSGGWVRREAAWSPLPIGYIEDMRNILAQGPHFSDWTWAQNASGTEADSGPGRDGGEWFAVNEIDIDKNDPDCVWRLREYEAGHSEFQMWSPIRWVALLIKLQLPLRMLQVRMLDSGEADALRFADGAWCENTHALADRTSRQPRAQGVFRGVGHLKNVSTPAVLYINTNKTADQKKSGPAKGYEVPWPTTGPIHQNPFYWLERLRNWQEKYNPITRRTSWSELGTHHIPFKSPEQLGTYSDTCFLFRVREAELSARHLPLSVSALNKPWYSLLAKLQERLRAAPPSDDNDLPVELVCPWEESNGGRTTHFPLQSLRVSLITALALDGQVPFPILQKLVGHSRLLMTLYYTKLGPTFVAEMLTIAAAKMDENMAKSIKRFAADAELNELLRKVVYNSEAGVRNAIPVDPGARNPAGWMLMHHGMCMCGGNTSEVEENRKIGGCHNGGPNVGTEMQPKWAPVPGGSRNCVRCRWFITQPQYLPSLVTTFNNHAYHFDEARNSCLVAEEKLQDIRRIKFEAESAGEPPTYMAEYLEIERVYEAAMKRFSDLAETLVATWRLIDRCSTALKDELGEGNQLIAVGALTDVSVAFDETESELLQLAGVCEGVEVYPDLQAGKAVFRRSQLLDLALMREGASPVFIAMSEADQLASGNAFIRQLASQAAPDNIQVGVRQVVQLMDSGEQVGRMLGIDLATLIPPAGSSAKKVIPIRPLRRAENTDLESA